MIRRPGAHIAVMTAKTGDKRYSARSPRLQKCISGQIAKQFCQIPHYEEQVL
jgi:hypothetical protein